MVSKQILQALGADLASIIADNRVMIEYFRQEPNDMDGRSDISRARIALYEGSESISERVGAYKADNSIQTYNMDISVVRGYANDKSDGELYIADLRDIVVDWLKTIDAAVVTSGGLLAVGYDGSGRTTRTRRYATKTLTLIAYRDLEVSQVPPPDNGGGTGGGNNGNGVQVIECGSAFLSGNIGSGIFDVPVTLGTKTGDFELHVEAFGVPDRFQILYDDGAGNETIIADSLFIGGVGIYGRASAIKNTTELDYLKFIDGDFQLIEQKAVNYDDSDIAVFDGSETRADGDGTGQIGVVANFPSATALASDGEAKLRFTRQEGDPQEAVLRIIGYTDGTAWNLKGFSCPE